MTPRCLTRANTCMMILFIKRVSEHRRGQKRGDESVWNILNLKYLWDIHMKGLINLEYRYTFGSVCMKLLRESI